MTDDHEPFDPDVPIEIKIDGTLDLHTFSPKDLKTLIPDYLEECHKRGIYELRIIHGKGIGAVARSVHALLGRSPLVDTWRIADPGPGSGGWGATLVNLKRP